MTIEKNLAFPLKVARLPKLVIQQKVQKTIEIPLYYTGLTDTARIRHQDGPVQEMKLDRTLTITLPVAVDGKSMTWFVIK